MYKNLEQLGVVVQFLAVRKVSCSENSLPARCRAARRPLLHPLRLRLRPLLTRAKGAARAVHLTTRRTVSCVCTEAGLHKVLMSTFGNKLTLPPGCRQDLTLLHASAAGLAKIVSHILPAGSYQWERVADIFNTNRPSNIPARDVTSLRNRYKKLTKHPKPTGAYRRDCYFVTCFPSHLMLFQVSLMYRRCLFFDELAQSDIYFR
jgi:hypothetical protein